jgi:hypothetical protein
MIKISGVFVILMIVISQQVYAVDKSIYYGKWKTISVNESVSLNLTKNKVTVAVNGKKITWPVKFEYVYSKFSPYPFLSIMFTDEQKTEHLIYVAIGAESKCRKTMLTGFYEKTDIIADSHGNLESVTKKIEFINN